MSVIFEDRSTYDATCDAIAVATVVVECNPGQLASLLEYARGVQSQAGVYSVSVDSAVIEPTPRAAAIEPEPVVEAVAVEEPMPVPIEASSAEVQPAEVQPAEEPKPEGASDGK